MQRHALTDHAVPRLLSALGRRLWRVSDSWHSWDPHPWKHPWLTQENLEAARTHSEGVWDDLRKHDHKSGPENYAFVGNLANNLYMRSVPLRNLGMQVAIVLHPQETGVMSHPSWEEFDGELPAGMSDSLAAWLNGPLAPPVADVYQCPDSVSEARAARGRLGRWRQLKRKHPYLRFADLQRWSHHLQIPTLELLQSFDALMAAQAPSLAYLSNKPYAAVSVGGDAWFDCSRNDSKGVIQRISYERANVVIAHQPWTFAHARRFGWTNVIYLPLMMDENKFTPGQPEERAHWERSIGGSFFAITTARLDDVYKGTDIGIEGFIRACRIEPELRLILMDWGSDAATHIDELRRRGLANRILILPRVGKTRLVRYLRSADCLIDQFVTGYYGATALEAMACGLPVIMRTERAQYDALCNTGSPPVLEAETPDDVAGQIIGIAKHKEAREKSGHNLRLWFVQNHSGQAWSQLYISLLRALTGGWRHPAKSPLGAQRSPEEEDYLESGARVAPPFPTYSI